MTFATSMAQNDIVLSCPDDNHPHAIDLGLPSGTKWACCNVGADKPEEYGHILEVCFSTTVFRTMTMFMSVRYSLNCVARD